MITIVGTLALVSFSHKCSFLHFIIVTLVSYFYCYTYLTSKSLKKLELWFVSDSRRKVTTNDILKKRFLTSLLTSSALLLMWLQRRWETFFPNLQYILKKQKSIQVIMIMLIADWTLTGIPRTKFFRRMALDISEDLESETVLALMH